MRGFFLYCCFWLRSCLLHWTFLPVQCSALLINILYLSVFHGMATNAPTALTHTTARATTWLQVGRRLWLHFLSSFFTFFRTCILIFTSMSFFDHPGNVHFKSSTFPCRENQSVPFSHQPAWGEDSAQETPTSWDLAGCVGSKVSECASVNCGSSHPKASC